MRFRFRLEKMLSILQMKEMTKKLEVAAVKRRIHQIQNKKASLVGTIQGLLRKQKERIEEREWAFYRNIKIEKDNEELKEIEHKIVKEKKVLDGKMAELTRLSCQKKALESLKQKRRKEHQSGEGLKEQKKIEELFRMAQGTLEGEY